MKNLGAHTRYELDEENTLIYIPNAIDPPASCILDLISKVKSRDKIRGKIFGKCYTMPRKQLLLSDCVENYTFSGQTLQACPMHPLGLEVIDKCKTWYPQFNWNTILCNYYENGRDHIQKHSDDEKSHQAGAPILTFSFGCPRLFRVKSKSGVSPKTDVVLEDLSCVVMEGTSFQRRFTHEIPKRLRVLEPRLSLTVRCFDVESVD